jgi:hypothetical protein
VPWFLPGTIWSKFIGFARYFATETLNILQSAATKQQEKAPPFSY